MSIGITDVDYVAKLAQLDIPEQEKPEFAQKMAAILNYMQQLQAVDTEGIAPTTHVFALENIFRADESGPCLEHTAALANAPEQEQGYFRVPRIL